MAGLSEHGRAEGTVHAPDGPPPPGTEGQHGGAACRTVGDAGAGATLDALAAPALAAAGMGVYQLDLRSRRLRLDAQSQDILHQSADASLQTVSHLVHPADLSHLRRVVRAAITGDAADYELELRVETPAGGTRWAHTRGTVLRSGDGSAAGLLGVLFDSTHDDSRRVGRFLEEIPTAFFALSRGWQFTYVNAAAERVLGRSRDELLDGTIWELFPAAVGSEFETHYRRVMETGEPVAFDAYYPAPLETWYEVRAWPAPDGVSVYFLDVTSRKDLQERTERAARQAALTAQVTADLARSLDAEEAVAGLAQTLVPELADWCIITLTDVDEQGEAGALRDIGWWHADAASLSLVEDYAHHRIAALTDGSFLRQALAGTDVVSVTEGATEAVQGVLAPGRARELIAELAPSSVTVLPLRGRERTLGAISLFNGAGRAPVPAHDLPTVREVADRAGLALDNAYLYARQRQLAEQLQRSFLTDPPTLDDVEVAVRYVPAAQAAKVGGDWYDVFDHPDGSTMLVIGDVAGHDVRAAAAMGQVRSLLRGIAVATGSGPADLLTEVDRAMRALGHDIVASAVVVSLESAGGSAAGPLRVRWSTAGHPPPMVLAADGSVATLAGSNLVLGVSPGTTRTEAEAALEPGSTLLLYTDGLVERRAEGGLRAGLSRLSTTLAGRAHRSLDELCQDLLTELLPDAPEDDVAILAVRPRPHTGDR